MPNRAAAIKREEDEMAERTKRYEVQGRGESENWDASYAGQDTECDTRKQAEEYIMFLLAEFPETTREDWRIVEIENA